MYFDIVCPDNNESDFIEMAKKLGYGGLCFVYEQMPEKTEDESLQVYYGLFAEDVKKARKSADFVVAKDVKNPRPYVEKYVPDLLMGMEKEGKKDFMHQRNSGVDNVISGLAAKKGVALGFSLKDCEDTKVLGRIMQNIVLCEKYNVDAIPCSMAETPLEMRNPRDVISLFSWLGMKNPKNSMQKIGEIIERNKKIRKGLFLRL